MNAPSLSVVLCTYNGERYLPAQLHSLLAQQRLPDEIVIGDDASSDGSWQQVTAFADAARDRGVRVDLYRQPHNLGFVANFADTLARARGEVVLLCDQDDVWHADKLARMAARFAADPELMLLFSDARLVDADGTDSGCSLFQALRFDAGERRRLRDDAFGALLRRSLVTGATAALRRSLLSDALPVGAGWIHDEWLALAAARRGRIEFIDDALIDYRQHGGNQIGMRRRTLRDRGRDLFRARGEVLRRDAQRMASLHERLGADEDDRRTRVDDRLQHVQQRLRLTALPRLRRLPLIAREWRSGGYRRHGTGWRSALRDLMRRVERGQASP